MPRRAKERFTVRRATTADLDALAELRNGMYRSMYPKLALDYGAYRKTYVSWVKKMMKRRKFASFLVCDSEGKTVAGGSVWVREEQPSLRRPGWTEVPYLMSMFTNPRYRRRGLATMVVKEAIKWSREHGYPRLTLHASQMGEPVYARLGFERTTEMRLSIPQPTRKPG